MRSKWSGVLLLVILAGLFLMREPEVQAEIAAACRSGPEKMAVTLDFWSNQGIVRAVSHDKNSAYVTVDSRLWAEIGRDAQISIGMAAYCRVADWKGRGSAVIEDGRQDRLGSVTNGHWSR